jgi:methyl-accepting chemotaxis protein
LAQRSAHAAKDIRSLIAESVEQTNAGSQLVDRAGDSVQQITARIDTLSGLTDAWRQASSVEIDGLQQVQDAVTELGRITQQQVESVAQNRADAQALQQQVLDLTTSVGFFRTA